MRIAGCQSALDLLRAGEVDVALVHTYGEPPTPPATAAFLDAQDASVATPP